MVQTSNITSTNPHTPYLHFKRKEGSSWQELVLCVSLEQLHFRLMLWKISESTQLSQLLPDVGLWRQCVLGIPITGESLCFPNDTTCSRNLASICQRTMSWPSIKTTSLPSEVWICCHTVPTEINIVNHWFLLCDCHSQDETEFRDKLSPININFNYSLDESSFEDSLTVKPILNYYQKNSLAEQVWILHATFSVYKHESVSKY